MALPPILEQVRDGKSRTFFVKWFGVSGGLRGKGKKNMQNCRGEGLFSCLECTLGRGGEAALAPSIGTISVAGRWRPASP